MMPCSASCALKVVVTETLSKTASTATPLSRCCSLAAAPVRYLDRNAQPRCADFNQHFAANTAAPSNPASELRITFTGIADNIAPSGGFARNARTKVPLASAGNILGAMPPPTKTPPVETTRIASLPASVD